MTANLLLFKNWPQESKIQSLRGTINNWHHHEQMFYSGIWAPYEGAWPWSCCVVRQGQAPSARRSFLGWPEHWPPLDKGKSVASAGENRGVITWTPWQILGTVTVPVFCCCCTAPRVLAPCLGIDRGDSAWPCWMCSCHSCCLPPPGHLGGHAPNSCFGKKDSAAGRGEMQITGVSSIAKSLAAGCAGCLGSYAGLFSHLLC